MRKISLLILLSLSVVSASYAQTPGLSKEGLSGAANPAKLLTQFTDAINPSSFTEGWKNEKTGWLGKAQKATSALSLANTVSSLAGFIKPTLFKQEGGAQNILQTANKVKTMAEAAGLLKSFEGALKPEAFVNSWSDKRAGWLSALSLLR